AEVREHLVELTEQAIALLLTDPLEHGRAEAIGASLARLQYTEAEVLGRTQELLAQQLVEGLPAEQVVALQPRLAALLGGLAAGFFQQVRELILAEQEQNRGALISDLQRAEGTLRKAYDDEVERRVQERAAELAVVNEKLRREIAERKRAEEAVKESESRLSGILSSMVDLVFAFDSEGRFIIHHSPRIGDLYVSPDEFIGKKHSEVMPPHLKEPFAEAFERNKKGEVAGYEYWLEIGGRVRWFSVKLSPVFLEGEFTGSVAVVREITELKQVEEVLREAHEELERRIEKRTAELAIANERLKREIEERKGAEEALRESEETARVLLNAPTDVAALIDTGGIILDANETMARRFRRHVDELIGSCVWDLFPSDVSERRKAHVSKVIQSGKPVRFEDEREGMWNDNVIYPVFDAQGKVKKVAALVRDITERRRAEEELRHYAERLKILREIDQAILAARSPEAIAQAALYHVRRLVPCLGGAVMILDFEAGEAIVLVAEVNGRLIVQTGTRLSLEESKGAEQFIESLRQGKVHVVEEDALAIPQPPPVLQTLQAEGLRSVLNVPLVAEDELIGFLSLGAGSPGPFAAEHVDIACEVAGPLAIAVQQARLFEQVRVGRERLRRLAEQIVSAQEDERQRLSHALHDEAGQALTALGISLELIREDLPVEFGLLRQRIGDAAALADATMEQIRLLAQDLRPPALDAVGLNPTLEAFCRDFARRTQLSIDYLGLELPMLPEAVNICLYRFLQEALTNVAKHACASQVCVALRYDAETVSLSVEDDGRGFDRQARLSVLGWPMGIGLLGMQERLESLGGRLEIESQPGQGTRLVAHLPAGGTT
ncbi:MAG: PAS domain-containing protein, partial [Anaerolineae bacterium]|nr:PAS domain-containing protein [Anaerolineae bacterium]